MASACASALMVGAANAQSFNNGSFETGTTQGWTEGGGYWNDPGNGYPTPVDYLPGGSRYDNSYTAITVTNAGFDPLTDNNLRLVYAGAHSVQVNDSNNNDSVSVLSQRVNNYTDPLIAFAYAAVLESSHTPTDSDAFIITLTDATTNEVLYTFNLNSATAPGVFTQSSQGWFYTDWVETSVDVSAREGHDFILSLLANDCPYGGHAGYAYLDGFGGVLGGGGTGGGTLVNQYWDGDGENNPDNDHVDGGNGTWTNGSGNMTVADGSTNNQYVYGNVIFEGAPGQVRVDTDEGDSPINVGGMEFLTSGYTVYGDPLTLSGSNVVVQVGDGSEGDASTTATIDSVLQGTSAVEKTGDGTLVLNGVNTYEGGTTVTGGTLVGSATSFGSGPVDDNATLVFQQPSDASFSNPISGTGDLIKTGAGQLNLTGTSDFEGDTEVQQGRLRVDGSIADSSVTVDSGASVGGYGTVGDLNALSGSVVAPGGSIGTLNVAGNYTAASGSTLQIEATAAGASDKLIVAGTTTIANGALLQVVNYTPASHFILGTRYTPVTSTGGVTGHYTLTGYTHVSVFVDVVDHYDPTHVYLDVQQVHSFASVGLTRNQIASASGSDTGTGALYTAIVYLQTAAEARAAFDATSGELHASSRGAALEDSRFLREAVVDRLRGPLPESGKVGWGHAFGSWGKTDSDGNAGKADRDIGGFFLGGDLGGGDGWRAGLVAGYSHSTLNVDSRLSRARTDDYHVGAYGGTAKGPWGVRVGASYTFRDIKTNRSAVFTGFSDKLDASYNANVAQVFADVGRKFGNDSRSLEPFVSLAYVNIQTDAFAEHGGVAALTVREGSLDEVFTTVGVRGVAAVTAGSNKLDLHGMLGWRHASGGDTPTARMAFTGGGNDFEVAGPPIGNDVLAIEAGVTSQVGSNLDLNVSYSGEIGDGVADHGVKASLRWSF